MRRILYGALLVLLLAALPAAAATSYPCADNSTSCDPYAPDLETGGDNTGGFKPPTADTCTAIGSKQQRCRSCEEAYDNSGQPKGYQVCAYVDRVAACSCTFNSGYCYPKGSCTYRFY